MIAKEFVINALKEWCNTFDGIRLRYAYDAKTEYHIVEVEPSSVYESKEYKQAELALWNSFMRQFPEEDLLICKPSKANDMTNCLFDSLPI